MLIVDDDFLFTDMLPRQLRKDIESPQLDIVSAKTPTEARNALATATFDIILCDYDLRAEDNGIRVLASAAEVAPTTFRILITGHTAREIGDLPAGAVHALVDKPMTLREVVPMLASVVQEHLGIVLEMRSRDGL